MNGLPHGLEDNMTDTDKTLREAAQELVDSMWRPGEPDLTLPPTNSSVENLRAALAATADAPEGPWSVVESLNLPDQITVVNSGNCLYMARRVFTKAHAIAVRDALNRLDAQEKGEGRL